MARSSTNATIAGTMPLEVAAIFLPYAGLIALVVMWLRIALPIPILRLVAEAVVTMLGVVAVLYGSVMVLHRLAH